MLIAQGSKFQSASLTFSIFPDYSLLVFQVSGHRGCTNVYLCLISAGEVNVLVLPQSWEVDASVLSQSRPFTYCVRDE